MSVTQTKKIFMLSALPVAVLAASAASPAYSQSAGATSLEEIVVTARRTEESLQSVPVSVTAFSADEIRRRGISSLEDIQLATPGVHLSGSGGRSNPVYMIRGQAKALSGTMSPAVVTYFDEVPEPNYGSYIPQFDLGSIQVLKGPQGTLFGRNTTGGAILYTAAAPEHELGGYVSANLGNYKLREYEGAVNIPLIQDTLAVRLAGITNKRDGYSRDLGADRDMDEDDYHSYRVSVLWEPLDNLSNTFMYNRTVTETNGDAIVAVDYFPGGPLPGTFGLDASLGQAIAQQNARGPRDVIATRDTFEDTKKTSINNRTELDIGGLTLVNIFGYRDVDLNYLANSDGLPVLTADGSGVYPAGTPVEYIKGSLRQELEQYTNEIQLMGKSFDDKLDWRVGAYWLKSEPTGPNANWVAFAAVAGTSGRNTAYNFQTEESQAVFAHGTYDLGDLIVDGLELELGVRYSEDETEACTGTGINSSTGVKLSACENKDTTQITGASVNTAKSDATTWSVGLNWQINEDHFAYVVSRRGYRAGGINSPTFSGRLAQFQSFEPETVTDGEVGIRSDWYLGDVAVRTNVSAFLGKYEDVQSPLSGVTTSGACAAFVAANPGVPVPAPISPDGTCTPQDDPAGNTLMMNMGESEVSGVDLELVISPIENLTFNFGASYLDAETKTLDKPAALAPYMASLTGITFNYVARKTATAAVNYLIPVGNPMLESVNLHGNLYWTDDIAFAGTWMMPGYTVSNLRVDFQGIGTPNLELGVYVRNAADKEYFAAGATAGATYGMNAGIYGPPRMYGAELRYNF
jgi:iron complex outermembrane receptor protein